jgi:hypothetical protein
MINPFQLEPIRRLQWWLDVSFEQPFLVAREVWRAQTRPFDRLKLGPMGAEIGVYRGQHLKALLQRHPDIQRVYAIDPYNPYPEMTHLDAAMADAQRRLLPTGKVTFVRSTAQDCNFAPASLDWVYIDGSHVDPHVSTDIHTAYEWVKPGGYVGGHDACRECPDVINAVARFCSPRNIRFNVHTPDFWFQKP